MAEAATTLARALALDPGQEEARFNLATLYEQQARTADAIAQYRRLADDTKTTTDLRRAAAERLRALAK